MSDSLVQQLFGALQDEMRAKLGVAAVLRHPVAKGDQSELNWHEMLSNHLPRRYLVLSKATVVDHTGATSDEIDLLLVDQQYSPLVFHSQARTFVPAEAVYAVFECKQGLDRDNVLYAADKVASVRQLPRTSAPIVHAGGIFEPRAPLPILGGLLTTRLDWSAGFGRPFTAALQAQAGAGKLDIGCAVTAGGWTVTYGPDAAPEVVASHADQAVMFFMLRLLAALQRVGTVPAMDYGAWATWIDELPPPAVGPEGQPTSAPS